jgi:hypothetical protein
VNSYDFRQPERIFFNPYNPSQVWASSFGNGMKEGDITTGVDGMQSEDFGVEIFPNPASEEFTIYDLRFTILGVEVFDARGEIVLSQKPIARSQKLTIDVSDFKNGIYFLRIDAG